jgi:hypothetical protein
VALQIKYCGALWQCCPPNQILWSTMAVLPSKSNIVEHYGSVALQIKYCGALGQCGPPNQILWSTRAVLPSKANIVEHQGNVALQIEYCGALLSVRYQNRKYGASEKGAFYRAPSMSSWTVWSIRLSTV